VITSFGSFLRDESGATAIEYGLIAALVCLAAVGSLTAFADSAVAMYQIIVDAMMEASPQ